MNTKAIQGFFDLNAKSGYNVGQQGVFGEYPLMTPKYAINYGVGQGRDNEFRETLARMYVSLAGANTNAVKDYLRSLPTGDERVKALAQVLVGDAANSIGMRGTGFIDFFLQQIQESWQEKVQVDEVLGDNYVAWFFGQSPPTFTFQGTLLNSQQDDQTTGFALAYQYLLRGTRLARSGSVLRLRYDNVIVSGAVLTMGRVINAENELVCPFSFSMLIKEYLLLLTPPYTKVSTDQFVDLQTIFASDAVLQKVTQRSDVRVRTTAVMPPYLNEESVAGSDDNGNDSDQTAVAPGDSAAALAAKSAQGTQQNPGSGIVAANPSFTMY